jgi:hypothetical protein
MSTGWRHTVQLIRVSLAPRTKRALIMRIEQKATVPTSESQGIPAETFAHTPDLIPRGLAQ